MNEPEIFVSHPHPDDKRFIDLTGKVFERLTVLGFAGSPPSSGKRPMLWNCVCLCGTIKVVHGGDLKKGHTRSCGCWQKQTVGERSETHGNAGRGKVTRVYRTWQNMLTRTTNLKSKEYHNYGGRGIKVCDRWQNSFENFLFDMGQPITAKHTLDRIDNEGGYCKENCRWATPKDQARNTRINHILEFNGKKACLAEWTESFGLRRSSLWSRLRRGWSVERALTTPIKSPTDLEPIRSTIRVS